MTLGPVRPGATPNGRLVVDEPTELSEGTEVDLVALEGRPAAVEAELRTAAAMKLYELGRLSSGAAAQVAGIPKPVFLAKLADYGIAALDQTEAELERDVLHA